MGMIPRFAVEHPIAGNRFVSAWLRFHQHTFSRLFRHYQQQILVGQYDELTEAVLEGLRGLCIAVAAVGWLSRYVAASRGSSEFELPDVAAAVAIVDRNAGRAPELGAVSARLRQKYLAQDAGVRRLLLRFRVGAS